MQIRFDDIPPQGLALEVKDHSWFPESELQRRGELLAEVNLERLEEERVLVTGRLKVTVILECDRCLEPYPVHLESSFRLNLEVAAPSESLPAAAREHSCRGDEMDTLQLEEPVVEVADLLRQQLYLALPPKRLCREGCKGLCPVCGGELNRSSCSCAGEGKESPFAVLRHLKK